MPLPKIKISTTSLTAIDNVEKQLEKIDNIFEKFCSKAIITEIGERQKIWTLAIKKKPKYLPKFIWEKLLKMIIVEIELNK